MKPYNPVILISHINRAIEPHSLSVKPRLTVRIYYYNIYIRETTATLYCRSSWIVFVNYTSHISIISPLRGWKSTHIMSVFAHSQLFVKHRQRQASTIQIYLKRAISINSRFYPYLQCLSLFFVSKFLWVFLPSFPTLAGKVQC